MSNSITKPRSQPAPQSPPHASSSSVRALNECELANKDDEALITHQMGAGPFHRIRLGGIFRIEKLLQDFHEQIEFSLRDETDGLSDRDTWSEVHEKVFKECFEPPRKELRSGDYLGIRQVGSELRVVYQFILNLSDESHRRFLRFRGHKGINWFVDIVSDSHEECEEMWQRVMDKYFIMHELPTSRRTMPTVQFLAKCPRRGDLNLTPMKMEDDRKMSPEELTMHYGGEGILGYQKQLLDSLEKDGSGLHLLQGAPGVGKTSLLLHLISTIKSQHQIIYLPTQYFETISSPESFSFWAELAEKRPEGKRTVLIVEDAEALIQAREQVTGYQASLVSNLLNCTDGILGQALGLHVVATFNTHVDKIDPALLRSGRLKTFREFGLLPRAEAEALATKLGRQLEVEREAYSLAEVYCGKPVKPEEEAPAVGFSQTG